MPVLPISRLRSKADRAIVAYLKQAGVADQIFPAMWSGILQADADGNAPVYVTIRCHSGIPVVQYSNTYKFIVEATVTGPAVPPSNAVNQAQPHVDVESAFGAMVDALMQSGQPQAQSQDLQATADLISKYGRGLATTGSHTEQQNNADMLDFTCQYWDGPTMLDGGNPKGEGQSPDNTSWREIAIFECIATPYNVDNLQ